MANERDEQGRDRMTGGVLGGTPDEQRHGDVPSGSGVYPGTPDDRNDGTRERGPSGSQPKADYGPLGWADVPGRPRPNVDEDAPGE